MICKSFDFTFLDSYMQISFFLVENFLSNQVNISYAWVEYLALHDELLATS